MKQFMVVKQDTTLDERVARLIFVNAPNSNRRGVDRLLYCQHQKESEPDEVLNANTHVYFVDTLVVAVELAEALCIKFPWHQYMVCEATSVYFAEPAKVQSAKFTEQGLLPQ